MAGATAIKGFMGFGCKSHMHTAKLLRLSEDLPVIVEIVDSKEKINEFLPFLDEMVRLFNSREHLSKLRGKI